MEASSEKHWPCTHISLQKVVQLCLWNFWSCICVFQSFVCNGKAAQVQKWCPQMCVIFFDACHNYVFLSPFQCQWHRDLELMEYVAKIHILDHHVLTMTVGLTRTCLN